MKCSKCGADNPDDAVSCSLCFTRFGQGDQDEISKLSPEMDTMLQKESATKSKTVGLFGRSVIQKAIQGGIAGAAGVLVFLVSLAVMQMVGLKLGDFLFSGRFVQISHLSVFLISIYLFGFMAAAVFGNVKERSDAALFKALFAASIVLAVWLVMLLFFIIRNEAADAVTSGLSIYTLVMLSILILAGALVALGDTIKRSSSIRAIGYAVAGGGIGSFGGVAAGMISMAMLNMLVSSTPASTSEAVILITKLILNTTIVGFIAGFCYWYCYMTAQTIGARNEPGKDTV